MERTKLSVHTCEGNRGSDPNTAKMTAAGFHMRSSIIARRLGAAGNTKSVQRCIFKESDAPLRGPSGPLSPSRRSIFFLRKKRRSLAALRCAPFFGSTPSTTKVSASGQGQSEHLTSMDDAAASDMLAEQLEEIEKARERLVEVVETENRRERNELERRDDLEAVAQAQAQLAVKAWEEYAQIEQFVVGGSIDFNELNVSVFDDRRTAQYVSKLLADHRGKVKLLIEEGVMDLMCEIIGKREIGNQVFEEAFLLSKELIHSASKVTQGRLLILLRADFENRFLNKI